MAERSQFELLGSRRFLPYFITQFLGAFNDNVFKQALVLAILFKIGTSADPNVLINFSALLFILPFFLFSALGGQFGEKFPKHTLIRLIKFAEIIIMLVGAASVF
ncbi:MAG: glycerol acyltransferase, partial [Gammaproteobacteria bacterium]|nr:glycerol acyltransferase [Gammaproteobacteria bacterium]